MKRKIKFCIMMLTLSFIIVACGNSSSENSSNGDGQVPMESPADAGNEPIETETVVDDGTETETTAPVESVIPKESEEPQESDEPEASEAPVDEATDPIDVTVENVEDLLSETSWIDDEDTEITFYDDHTAYVISSDGEEMEAEWQVLEMEDSVVLYMIINENENMQFVSSCSLKEITFDDGTVFNCVEE